MSLQFHIIFDAVLYTVVSIIAVYQEVCIRLVMSINSRIWVMLDQGNDPELFGKWLIAYDRLTCYNKSREDISKKIKVLETPFDQGLQF